VSSRGRSALSILADLDDSNVRSHTVVAQGRSPRRDAGDVTGASCRLRAICLQNRRATGSPEDAGRTSNTRAELGSCRQRRCPKRSS